MKQQSHLEPGAKKRIVPAMLRGFRGRCPKCGAGKLLSGYMRPVPECDRCGEDLAPYQTADFASYLVMFAVGLLFMPVVLVVSISSAASSWLVSAVVAIALVSALLLLPRAKGAGIALLWALDIKANQ